MKLIPFLLTSLSLFLTSTRAFCIYNDSQDNTFWMRQLTVDTGGTYFSRFQIHSMAAGGDACCNYASYDCNTTRDPDTILGMGFQASYAGVAKNDLFTVNFPAGGWIELYGNGPDRNTVNVYYANGTVFQYDLQWNPPDILLTK